ncbi:MAG: hypothetical protein J7L82_04285 [Staphylothermus sp.]|nr:hypothetical protein [Staphylothermus sp.]
MNTQSMHRSKIDLIESILKYIHDEGYAKKTHILYASNLNTRSLEKFLKYLIEIKAVEVVEKQKQHHSYVITMHGREILRIIMKLKMLLNNRRGCVKDNRLLLSRLNKALSSTLKDKFVDILNKEVRGLSGLTYDLDILKGQEGQYILIPIASMVDDQCRELDSAVGKALLSVLDTNYKCVILLSDGENNCAHIMNYIKNLFNKIGIDESRYYFALL